jgi:hypothetical protein
LVCCCHGCMKLHEFGDAVKPHMHFESIYLWPFERYIWVRYWRAADCLQIVLLSV